MGGAGVTLASALLVVVLANTIPNNTYTPTVEQIKLIFPDEYEHIREQKRDKQVANNTCAKPECTLEEIYKIFEADSAGVGAVANGKANGSDDRVAITGDDCPTGKVRVNDMCIETD